MTSAAIPIPAVSNGLPATYTSAASSEASKGTRVIPPDQVRVIDGDTVDIGGERMRLFGIDAPEKGQKCVYSDGLEYNCSTAATRELRALLSLNMPPVIERRGVDRYGRSIVVLRDQTGLNLNCELVARGLAWAYVDYSDMCVADEAHARTQMRGVFNGVNLPPWEYRRKQKSNSNRIN